MVTALARVPTPQESKIYNKEAMHMPRPYKIRGFYTPKDVAAHNSADDCWVSLFNCVYDLTRLLEQNSDKAECDPIVLAAGTDISHWFNEETRCPKTYIDPATGQQGYHYPQGRFLHVPPTSPNSDWDTQAFVHPWWEDVDAYGIGRLTECTREVRIINMLTKHDDLIECCDEESINEILDRYLEVNAHAASYTWKRLGKKLDMGKNLTGNGIGNGSAELMKLGLAGDIYVQAIHLYYDDDLTIA